MEGACFLAHRGRGLEEQMAVVLWGCSCEPRSEIEMKDGDASFTVELILFQGEIANRNH